MSDILAPEATLENATRGPGRPKASTEPAVKKGKPTWKPASVIKVKPREGYTPRMINKNPDNMARKMAEGWEIESGLSGSSGNLEQGYGRIDDGKSMTSVSERHDCILGWLPNETAEARREYYNNQTIRLEQAMTRDAKNEMGKATGGKGTVHGSITLEKRGVRQTIE